MDLMGHDGPVGGRNRPPQVYASRLDDPASGTFERCSIDTFRVAGPCGDRTCYLYLRRSGCDGWTPEYVKVFYSPGDSRAAVTFFYKVPLPDGVWYGFNLCHGGTVATASPGTGFNLLDATVERKMICRMTTE
ncbi:hypothetical protein Taro_036795 [Colocasia esculenta]|uniref:Uncharacterized protein n=1 Tax=Colocasia esculenta TaxID=4460 RepID=A0A843W9E2_COLES|nr:hypothetical protein [Colocasia esculenta]